MILVKDNAHLIAFTGRAKVLSNFKGAERFISVSACLINIYRLRNSD